MDAGILSQGQDDDSALMFFDKMISLCGSIEPWKGARWGYEKSKGLSLARHIPMVSNRQIIIVGQCPSTSAMAIATLIQLPPLY